MFFVINKEKVYAYIVSILTIVVLFFMSHFINYKESNSKEVSSNIVNNETIMDDKNSVEIETGIVPN